jgi:steroid delta-isomerase-like uncharacterized protein
MQEQTTQSQDATNLEQTTIPELVDDVRAGKMNRRELMKALAVMGVSAAGAGAIAAVAINRISAQAPAPSAPTGGDTNAQLHINQHNAHLIKQATGNVQQLHSDYHENAIVEDSMFPHPFIGREAILKRKSAGFTAMPDLQINVTNRVVHGDQLTVEWIATGTHKQDYPGLPATGRSFSIPGVTVVVRKNGKIVRESLYYDMAEVQRQLGGKM